MVCAPMLFVALLAKSQANQSPINLDKARRYFQLAQWASADDGGKMWGKPLYGPMIFVDRGTRFAVANEADKDGQLREQKGVWIGAVPPSLGAANTSIDWSGTNWTMVMWPLPDSPVEATRLMMHECFHRIQKEIGLPGPLPEPHNAHLDTKDGRIWLRLEYRALMKALPSWGAERRQALTDALTFRAYRQSLFPGSAAGEDSMEMHEGMAEYTGVANMGLGNSDARYYLSGRMKVYEHITSFPFSFAYQTGPAYGLMLDMDGDTWHKNATPKSSLTEMLRSAAKLSLPADLKGTALARAKLYDGDQIFAEEEKREQDRLAHEKQYRKTLVDGPVLILPLGKDQSFTFDPLAVFPLGAAGTVYPEGKVSDAWGYIDVTKGFLMNPSYSQCVVSAPTGPDGVRGDGWKLTLNQGWKVVAAKRKGDFTLVKG